MGKKVSVAMVKALREKSGTGVMDCRRALLKSRGNLEKALRILREEGLSKAAKKRGRETRQGLIASYIHPGGKIGVLVEVNCETDFVARTEEFKQLVKDITMQIAACQPHYISRDLVPKKVKEGIAAGKLRQYLSEQCLLEQLFVKDTEISVEEHLKAQIAKLGENIKIRRFVRYELGEEG